MRRGAALPPCGISLRRAAPTVRERRRCRTSRYLPGSRSERRKAGDPLFPPLGGARNFSSGGRFPRVGVIRVGIRGSGLFRLEVFEVADDGGEIGGVVSRLDALKFGHARESRVGVLKELVELRIDVDLIPIGHVPVEVEIKCLPGVRGPGKGGVWEEGAGFPADAASPLGHPGRAYGHGRFDHGRNRLVDVRVFLFQGFDAWGFRRRFLLRCPPSGAARFPWRPSRCRSRLALASACFAARRRSCGAAGLPRCISPGGSRISSSTPLLGGVPEV